MTQRTYWHLESLGRKPNEYDIVTSRLLYYPSRGFEIATPIGQWYEKYQRSSALHTDDWDKFRDPRETTYRSYTEIQQAREIYVDGLLESIEQTNADAELSPECMAALERVLPVLRYPVHGLQMTAAYVGQMAPGGRVVMAAMFQAADEVRRTQRIAYRMRQLQLVRPDFGADSRAAWQSDPAWQPLRQVIERLLVTYDWSKALVALNVVVKPLFDDVFMVCYGDLLRALGEETQPKILRSLYEDCAWHIQWSSALLRMLMAADPSNAGFISESIERWRGPAVDALTALGPLLGELAESEGHDAIHGRLERVLAETIADLRAAASGRQGETDS